MSEFLKAQRFVRLRRLALCAGLAALISACGAKGPNEMREYLNRDGLWGWDAGAGCEDRANAWLIDGVAISIFQNGEVIERMRLVERRALYDNRRESGDGALEYADWLVVARNPDDPELTSRHEIFFAIRGGPGRPTALRPNNERTFIHPETGERSRVSEPYQGDRLVHCDEWAAHQG